MATRMLTADSVLGVARRMLNDAVSVERHPIGFGNENWIVRDDQGSRRWILKVGDPASEAKWRSAHRALDLARSVGVPAPELVGTGHHDGWLVRVFTWIDGEPPAAVLVDERRRERFVHSLAAALRALHSIDTGSFSSRLDGSAPEFASWSGYVHHRLGQIRRRCIEADAVDEPTLTRAQAMVEALSAEVSPSVRPAVCHRDLHPGNLLVDPEGSIVGIIDWDTAESWDPAAEWFKLEWMLAAELPVDLGLATSMYRSGHAEPTQWDERVRLVHIMETLNTIPNAVTHFSAEFVQRARARLAELLD